MPPHGAKRPTTRIPSHTVHKDPVRNIIRPITPVSLVGRAPTAAGYALEATYGRSLFFGPPSVSRSDRK